MDYDQAVKALDKAAEHLDPEELDALSGFVAMFKPYKGDDPEEAKERRHMEGHCANCGYSTPLMFFPSLAEQVAITTLRLAQCPRCYSTKIMCGKAPASPG